jgi:hypothetical protein
MRGLAEHTRLHAVLAALLLLGLGSAVDGRASAIRQLPPRCQEGSLEIADAGPGGVSAGQAIEAIEFRSDRRCYLRGYPSVWLLSKARRRLAVVPRERAFDRPVVLAQGRPTYADLQYENPNNNPKACRLMAYYMAIRVPGGSERIEVEFQTTPMRFCPEIVAVTAFGGIGPAKF